MQTPPTVEQLKQYYSSFYWSRSSRTSAVKNVVVQQDVHLRDPRALHQIDFVWPAIGSKPLQNVLEIGAGSASSLLLLKHKCGEPAPALHVCEPGSQWEDHYRQHRVARIADYFPFETAVSFDYIHTSHWLEHVSKLGETVGHLRDMLKPGGYVFVEVPNTEHDYWTQAINDVPHIHFFTPRSLQRAFEVQGLKCLKLEEAGITFNDHCKGIKPTAEDFGPREKGFWIRALFIKESQQS
ncbi:MAG: class I SAM-dependent methyltransferase [Pseudomonadota bacterium]